jgi:hypothetical protein
MDFANAMWSLRGSGLTRALVQTVAQLLAGIEERDVLLGHRDAVAGPWIAAGAGIAVFD